MEIFYRLGGLEAACQVVRDRRGGMFDPQVADTFLHGAKHLVEPLETESAWDAALAAEPEPWRFVPETRLDDVARTFADFADLKSPFMLGHSAGVAQLAGAAAQLLGMGDGEVTACRRAGWLHDIGREAVPTGIWDKQGRLTAAEWERVRLHGYYTERVLARSPRLEPLAQLAGLHHERLDGSGYHRGARATGLSRAARVIAAADVYQALSEERPYRSPLAPDVAASELRADADAGRLDREAVEGVLQAGGHRPRRIASWPAGRSGREVEVLRLVARGR